MVLGEHISLLVSVTSDIGILFPEMKGVAVLMTASPYRVCVVQEFLWWLGVHLHIAVVGPFMIATPG